MWNKCTIFSPGPSPHPPPLSLCPVYKADGEAGVNGWLTICAAHVAVPHRLPPATKFCVRVWMCVSVSVLGRRSRCQVVVMTEQVPSCVRASCVRDGGSKSPHAWLHAALFTATVITLPQVWQRHSKVCVWCVHCVSWATSPIVVGLWVVY